MSKVEPMTKTRPDLESTHQEGNDALCPSTKLQGSLKNQGLEDGADWLVFQLIATSLHLLHTNQQTSPSHQRLSGGMSQQCTLGHTLTQPFQAIPIV